MRLHLIVLAALIAVPAIETGFEHCEKFCENGNDEDSEYCLTLEEVNCHFMFSRCFVKELKCIYKEMGFGKLDSDFHKNCHDMPKCDKSPLKSPPVLEKLN